MVGCGGDAIDGIERAHDSHGSRFDASLEGWQVRISQGPFGDFRVVLVTSACCRAIAHIVFQTGCHMIGRRHVVALETPDLCGIAQG